MPQSSREQALLLKRTCWPGFMDHVKTSTQLPPDFDLPCLGLATETSIDELSRAGNPGTGVISADVSKHAAGHYLSRGNFMMSLGNGPI